MVSFLEAIPFPEHASHVQRKNQDVVSQPSVHPFPPLSNSGPFCCHAPSSRSRWKWFRPVVEGRAPSPRGGHTATLVDDRLVVFGGHKYGGSNAGFVYHNDLHVLHLRTNNWSRLRHLGTQPAPRYGHSAALVGRKIIIFGGKGKKQVYFNDLHALEVDSYTWLQGPAASTQPRRPAARFGHSCNVDEARRCLYFFGGVREQELYNDFYCFDLECMGWSLPATKGIPPTPRFGHAALLVNDYLLISGGMHRVQLEVTEKHELLRNVDLKDWYTMDLIALELESLTWHRLRTRGSPPPPRFGHSVEAVGKNIVIFGGWAGSKVNYNTVTKDTPSHARHQTHDEQVAPDELQILPSNLLSSFNTEKMMWESCVSLGNPPMTRYGHSCTRVGSKLIIFGGWDATISLNDVTVLSEGTPNQLEKVSVQGLKVRAHPESSPTESFASYAYAPALAKLYHDLGV